MEKSFFIVSARKIYCFESRPERLSGLLMISHECKIKGGRLGTPSQSKYFYTRPLSVEYSLDRAPALAPSSRERLPTAESRT